MHERKEPPEYNGGKFPANDRSAAKGLALAEFIDAAGVSNRENAPVQGSLRHPDVGPIPPSPTESRERLDIVLMEHPFALAAGSLIAGFALGFAASAMVRSRAKSRNDNDLAPASQHEAIAVEFDFDPRPEF